MQIKSVECYPQEPRVCFTLMSEYTTDNWRRGWDGMVLTHRKFELVCFEETVSETVVKFCVKL